MSVILFLLLSVISPSYYYLNTYLGAFLRIYNEVLIYAVRRIFRIQLILLSDYVATLTIKNRLCCAHFHPLLFGRH